jgi:multiple sugar transport system ATP-binding protein
MAEIRLENVTKQYGDVKALDDVSLTIADGSFTSVFGPPGSGKSVLLRVLLGLEPIDSGQILIDGRDVTNAPPNSRNLAMVFQNLALFPHLTARQNIAFPMHRRNVNQSEIDEKLDPIARVLNIAHILHKKPGALSGGERQRVAIGRALIRDAVAYMMDEPIAALDARLRDVMRVELKRLQSEFGQTFIYVTHDCDEAMSVADRMAILERGRVAQFDLPDKIYDDPASLYVAQLVGSPRINVLDGQISGTHIDCAFGALRLDEWRSPLSSPTTAIDVALRPEALKLTVPSAQSCNGVIQDVEHLGSFSIVTVGAKNQTVRVINTGDTKVSIGESVGLSVRPDEIMMFRPEDGMRVY